MIVWKNYLFDDILDKNFYLLNKNLLINWVVVIKIRFQIWNFEKIYLKNKKLIKIKRNYFNM